MSELYAEPLQQIDRTYVLWRGRKLIYFAGCDYLRLSSHPKVLAAFQKSVRQFGLNVAASRKTTGNHRLYTELESSLRKFFRDDATIISSTGYFTNINLQRAEDSKGNFTFSMSCEFSPPSSRPQTDIDPLIQKGAN